MKKTPLLLLALLGLVCLAASVKISDYNEKLTLADTNFFELSVPGDPSGTGSWKVAYGTLRTSLVFATGTMRLQLQSCILPTNNAPGLDTGSNYVWRLLFDDTTDETAYWDFVLPYDYQTNAILVLTYSTLAAAANKTNVFSFATQVITEGSGSLINSSSFTLSGGVTNIIPTTAGWIATCSGNLSLSTVPGAFVRLRVNRDADNADDSATGDTALHAITIRYTKR